MIRILKVDDHQEWRRRVSLLLEARPDLQVVGEASDGSEAVQRADELKPDLILLDIGLPKQNGIEAARQILQLSPGSKIIFLSQDNSLQVVQKALSTGAMGYVYKADAGNDLLPAVEAAICGRQFVSRSVKGYKRVDPLEEDESHRHEVVFYSEEATFLESFTRFIAAALLAGNAAISNVRKSHGEELIQRLRAEGVDVDRAMQEGTYISLNAADTFSKAMVNGLIDPDQFMTLSGDLIDAAAKASRAEHPRVALCGEGVGLLWVEGKTDAAIRVEQCCNDLCNAHNIDMLCAYPLRGISGEEDRQDFQSICEKHSSVHSR